MKPPDCRYDRSRPCHRAAASPRRKRRAATAAGEGRRVTDNDTSLNPSLPRKAVSRLSRAPDRRQQLRRAARLPDHERPRSRRRNRHRHATPSPCPKTPRQCRQNPRSTRHRVLRATVLAAEAAWAVVHERPFSCENVLLEEAAPRFRSDPCVASFRRPREPWKFDPRLPPVRLNPKIQPSQQKRPPQHPNVPKP
jgi:hypothetical protein